MRSGTFNCDLFWRLLNKLPIGKVVSMLFEVFQPLVTIPFVDHVFCIYDLTCNVNSFNNCRFTRHMSVKHDNEKQQRGYSMNCNPLVVYGALGGIRTPDLRIRSPLLYPAELRAHSLKRTLAGRDTTDKCNTVFWMVKSMYRRKICKKPSPEDFLAGFSNFHLSCRVFRFV